MFELRWFKTSVFAAPAKLSDTWAMRFLFLVE
jgi:hypothetical protein